MIDFETELKKAWDEWHNDLGQHLMPEQPDPSFIKGFEMAWGNRQEVLNMIGGAFYRLDKYGYLDARLSLLDNGEKREAEHWINVGRDGLEKR